MEKNIKDYLHLYFISPVSVTNIEGRYETVVDHEFWNTFYNDEDGSFLNNPLLILRPLSDMTKQELGEWALVCGSNFTDKELDRAFDGFKKQYDKQGINMFVSDEGKSGLFFELTKFLLSKGFDLFGLIDSGLAINKTTIR